MIYDICIVETIKCNTYKLESDILIQQSGMHKIQLEQEADHRS